MFSRMSWGPESPTKDSLRRSGRARAIFYTTRNGGPWVTSRRAQIHAALKNPHIFASSATNIPRYPDGIEKGPLRIPITVDPPAHTKYRTLLDGFFSPAAVGKMEESTRKLANELIDNVANRDEFDFVAEIAIPLPVLIFLTMMDMPLGRYRELASWVTDFFIATEEAAQIAVMVRIQNYMATLVDQRTATPGEDVISRLLQSEEIGREEVLSICNLLFLAGLDTVTSALSYLTYDLSRNSRWIDQLRANPELVSEVIEESLRINTIPNTIRRIAVDTEFDGLSLKQNEVAWLMLSVAKRDDEQIEQPDVSIRCVRRNPIWRSAVASIAV